MIPPLEPPDSHHLQAALGWIGLGNFIDANEELEKVTPQLRSHPDVLAVRWQVYAHYNEWDVCLDLGKALMDLAPEHPLGSNYYTISLHKLGRTEEAWKTASAKLLRFEKDWQLHYNSACYAANLGFIEECRELFELALDLAENKQFVRESLLSDPDLEPLRKEFKL